MRYLSDQWLSRADTALGVLEPLNAAVLIGFVVEGGPEGDRPYMLELGPQAVRVVPGVDERAAVTLRLDWAVAVGIATGEASAQRAFLDGELVVGGDIGVLLGNQKVLATIDDHLAILRAETEF